MALLHDTSAPKNPYAAGFKGIHTSPNKLVMSILETTSLTGYAWKKNALFDSLADNIRSQIASQNIIELIGVIFNELPIDTITSFMEAYDAKENVIKNVLNINSLVGKSILQSNGNTAKLPQMLDLTDRSKCMVYVVDIYSF